MVPGGGHLAFLVPLGASWERAGSAHPTLLSKQQLPLNAQPGEGCEAPEVIIKLIGHVKT